MVRRRVIVRGLVQGVFFRDSTRRLARQHGVSGWIANRADGAVEAVVEGEADAGGRALPLRPQRPRGAPNEGSASSKGKAGGLPRFARRGPARQTDRLVP